MSAITSLKVNFQGKSRTVEIPSTPVPTLAIVADAVISAFQLDVDENSGQVSFTYRDPDGDDVKFDTDAELALAFRLCPRPLEITASVPQMKPDNDNKTRKPHDLEKIYRVAARNLRESHDVLSINGHNLKKTLVMLKLQPRRLVVQGLAPRPLLTALRKKAQDARNADAKIDSSGSAAVSGGDVSPPEPPQPAMASDEEQQNKVDAEWEPLTVEGADADAGNDNDGDGQPKTVRRPIHAAFVAAGIKIRPRDARPLLLALGVKPHRLVNLGLVDRDALFRSKESLAVDGDGKRAGPGPHRRNGPNGPNRSERLALAVIPVCCHGLVGHGPRGRAGRGGRGRGVAGRGRHTGAGCRQNMQG